MVRKLLLLTLFCVTLQAGAQDDSMLALGKVLDAVTHKGISANIHYSSIPTGSIYGGFLDSTFSFPIFGVAKYRITAKAEGYNARTVIVDPKDMNERQRIIRNILLTPAGQAIRLNNLIFSQGQAHIDPKSHSELDDVVVMMTDNEEIVIQLEGHTDNVGSAQANMRLSEERVEAVKRYIVSKGISRTRIKTKAFGGSKPLANEMTSEARNLNRRVEMRILSD